MTMIHRYSITDITDRLVSYGLPSDVVYAIKNTVVTFRLCCHEAQRLSSLLEQRARVITECASDGETFSTEDLAVTIDDLSRLSGVMHTSRDNIEHTLTLAQHIVGSRSHEFMMEMSTMIWS